MLKKVALAISALTLATSAMAASLPDTPVAFKSGAGAMSNGVIYIGLGTAGQDWYKIDTKSKTPAWEKIAQFPGQNRDQAQAVAVDGKILVFGGVGKATADATRISVSNEVYSYDTKKDEWTLLDTRSPIGLTGHSATTADGKNVLIVGSVNKPIFDGFFQDLEKFAGDKDALAKLNADYISKTCADYFFNEYVLSYDLANNLWHNLGKMPIGGTAGSALAVDNGVVTVMNGERKPGLRTAKALQFTVDQAGATFTKIDDVCPADGSKVQDGVAGAFAGSSNDAVLLAGGANFPGSTVAYEKGKNFAHEGLTKTWRDEIYAYVDGKWQQAGKLPLPLGYGVTIQNSEELYLIGGETTGGKPTNQVITLSFENNKLVTK